MKLSSEYIWYLRGLIVGISLELLVIIINIPLWLILCIALVISIIVGITVPKNGEEE
jgi:hypothetical protein